MTRAAEQTRTPSVPGDAMDRPRGAEVLALSGGVLVLLFLCLILFTTGRAQAQEIIDNPDSQPPDNAAEPASSQPVASPQPDATTPRSAPGQQVDQEPQPPAESLPADGTRQDPTAPVSTPDGTYSDPSPPTASPGPATRSVPEPTQGADVYQEPMPEPEPQVVPAPQEPVTDPPTVIPTPTDQMPAEPMPSDPVPTEQVPGDPVISDSVPKPQAHEPVPIAAPVDSSPPTPDAAPVQEPVSQDSTTNDPAPVVSPSTDPMRRGIRAAAPAAPAPVSPGRVVAPRSRTAPNPEPGRPAVTVSRDETALDPAPAGAPAPTTPKATAPEAPAPPAESPPRAGLQGHRRAALKSMISEGAEGREDAPAPSAGAKVRVVERLADGLVLTANAVLESVTERVGTLIEGSVERLADGLQRAVEGLLGGTGEPADGVVPPASFPAPPPAPVSSACSSGSSLLSGESGSCGGAAEKLFHQFAALAPFSAVIPSLDGEVNWLSREPLVPNSAPRPPNERPG